MTRVYRFGLLPPKENAKLVRDQMSLAHRYRNRLTEVERARRAKLREFMSTVGNVPEFEAAFSKADAVLDEALAVVRKERAATRKRSETPEQKRAVTVARGLRSFARKALTEARQTLRSDPKVLASIDAINEASGAAVRAARAECGVAWGTYLLIEDAVNASRKMPLHDGLEASDPHFVRWTGEGSVGVQLQGGLSTVDAFAQVDTQFKIELLPPRSDSKTAMKLRHAILWMRVGSEGRAPVWASWPMLYHRKLPALGVIKRVTVNLRKVGPRESWTACITVEEPKTDPVCGKGAVAVDLGWRTFRSPDGGTELRVAAYRGSDGASGELRIPSGVLSSLKYDDHLRGIRDNLFDTARLALLRWTSLFTGSPLPDWMKEALKTLSLWKSFGRLAALCRHWRDNRFDGDFGGYDELERWRYKDHHLWSWEASQRRKSLGRRKDLYRCFAKQLATQYDTLVLEKFDLRVFARRSLTEDSAENETSRSNRVLASPGELRLVLSNAFSSRGGLVEKVNSADTTQACAVCGALGHFNAAEHLVPVCPSCGRAQDQDDRAAENLLMRFERSRGEEMPESARHAEKQNRSADSSESRWVKARRMASEKANRQSTRSHPL